jgi:hypothetical protein
MSLISTLISKMPTDYAGFAKADKQDQAIVVGVASVTIVASLALFNTLAGSNPIGRTLTIMTTFGSQEKKRNIAVNDWIDEYNDLHDGKLDTRNESYTTLVNAYYELATSFYEWGWGESFHFANQLPGETFKTAIARHEYYLAGRLGVAKGAKVLDCGCGIGGPMRNIAKFTNANITGVTLNEVSSQVPCSQHRGVPCVYMFPGPLLDRGHPLDSHTVPN